MYYALFPASDEDGNMMSLTYASDHRARSFVRGQVFLSDPNARPWERPPAEPMRLTIESGGETAPFPSFLREPVPLVSKALLSVLRSAGVDNLDVYRSELYYADGRIASDDYYVFNLIGLVKAADLTESTFDTGQPDRLGSMGFDSLTIDTNAARGLLMFRLAENVSTIIIHEVVKKAIEAAKIHLIKALKTEEVAVL
jgi:hypothetical protein